MDISASFPSFWKFWFQRLSLCLLFGNWQLGWNSNSARRRRRNRSRRFGLDHPDPVLRRPGPVVVQQGLWRSPRHRLHPPPLQTQMQTTLLLRSTGEERLVHSPGLSGKKWYLVADSKEKRYGYRKIRMFCHQIRAYVLSCSFVWATGRTVPFASASPRTPFSPPLPGLCLFGFRFQVSFCFSLVLLVLAFAFFQWTEKVQKVPP